MPGSNDGHREAIGRLKLPPQIEDVGRVVDLRQQPGVAGRALRQDVDPVPPAVGQQLLGSCGTGMLGDGSGNRGCHLFHGGEGSLVGRKDRFG